MAKFEVGDEVRCILTEALGIGSAPPLRLKMKYSVRDTQACKCGNNAIDVGIRKNYTRPTHCSVCDRIFKNDSIRWCASRRFKHVLQFKRVVKCK